MLLENKFVFWLEDTSQKSLKIPGIEVFDFKSQILLCYKKYIFVKKPSVWQHNRANVKYTSNQEIHGVNTR
jgi:hypothetical protein